MAAAPPGEFLPVSCNSVYRKEDKKAVKASYEFDIFSALLRLFFLFGRFGGLQGFLLVFLTRVDNGRDEVEQNHHHEHTAHTMIPVGVLMFMAI